MATMHPIRLLLLFALATCASPAQAGVEIAFHTKDFGSSFPHAFVRISGTLDRGGQSVDENFGFTAVRVSPGILLGPVRGMIQSVGPEYVARSDRHFSLKLTDDQYRSVLAVVDKWRNAPQPSYRLNNRNCITFVAEVAKSLGLQAPNAPKLMKKPKSYLAMLTEQNRAIITTWPVGRDTVRPADAPSKQAAAVTAR